MAERFRHDSDGLLLDVMLSRNGETRHWTIEQDDNGWRCRYLSHQSATFTGCRSLELALAQRAKWLVEIEAAKADGWVFTPPDLPIG